MITFKEVLTWINFLAIICLISWILFSGSREEFVEAPAPAQVASCDKPSYPFADLKPAAAKYDLQWALFAPKNKDIIVKYYNLINNTNLKPDTVGIYVQEGNEQVLVIMLKGVCVISTSQVEAELLYALINGKAI